MVLKEHAAIKNGGVGVGGHVAKGRGSANGEPECIC